MKLVATMIAVSLALSVAACERKEAKKPDAPAPVKTEQVKKEKAVANSLESVERRLKGLEGRVHSLEVSRQDVRKYLGEKLGK
jgi:hypothetical protein